MQHEDLLRGKEVAVYYVAETPANEGEGFIFSASRPAGLLQR